MANIIATALLSVMLFMSPSAFASESLPTDHYKLRERPCVVEGAIHVMGDELNTGRLQASCQPEVRADKHTLRMYRPYRGMMVVVEVPYVQDISDIEMQYMWGSHHVAFRYRVINQTYEYLTIKPEGPLYWINSREHL